MVQNTMICLVQSKMCTDDVLTS
uniref:Uncharacterized protein n=1 Tax=Anguilla anguilla TaxID=7936 RepID=A0A0E9W4F9_ANGAN